MSFKILNKLVMIYLYFIFSVLFYTCESKLIYNCQNGFSKFGNNCYYLSTKAATWQEAYFECKYLTSGSKLVVLPKQVDDHNIRKFFKYTQNEANERWIGGIYDWRQDHWKWANSGHKIQYNNFEKIPHFDNELNSHWQCIALDPNFDNKWTAHSCLQKKYFVCETKPYPECINIEL